MTEVKSDCVGRIGGNIRFYNARDPEQATHAQVSAEDDPSQSDRVNI